RTGGGFDDRDLAETQKALTPLITKKCPFKEVPAEVKKATWVQPRLVCEVRFNEWTSDKKLRAPIFQGFRDDIDPEDCLLEDSVSDPLPPTAASPSVRGRMQVSPLQRGTAGEAGRGSLTSSPRIDFTNLDKIFWPEDGYTKGDLINYYDKIS